MSESILPQKRNGEDDMVSPKTKAQKKEEAILKAREWARKRKGGGDDNNNAALSDEDGGGGGVSSSPTKKKAAIRAEEEDVITNLPNIPDKKKSSSSRGEDVVSDTESIGSRTRSRRRSVGVPVTAAPAAAPAAAPPKAAAKASTKKSSPRKTPAKAKKKAAAAAVEEQVVEEPEPPAPPVEEEKKEAAAAPEETQAAEAKEEEEAVQEEANEDTKTSFLPHFAVFLHSIIIQWSIAFAVIMTFCLDWWSFQFGPSNVEVLSSQRASSAILGIWLVTIAGYSIAFGTFSQVGWILTTSSLAMLSFAVKMLDEDISSASLPVYRVFRFGINIPDLLLCISLAACIFVMKQPPVAVEEAAAEAPLTPSEPAVTPTEPAAAPLEEEPPSSVEANAEESKEVMEAVMIATKEATGPRSLIGQRVSVEDSGFPSFGTVADYDAETRLWTILFDDENQEEGWLNRVELASAFKSYSKHLADSLKAMWKSGEI